MLTGINIRVGLDLYTRLRTIQSEYKNRTGRIKSLSQISVDLLQETLFSTKQIDSTQDDANVDELLAENEALKEQLKEAQVWEVKAQVLQQQLDKPKEQKIPDWVTMLIPLIAAGGLAWVMREQNKEQTETLTNVLKAAITSSQGANNELIDSINSLLSQTPKSE